MVWFILISFWFVVQLVWFDLSWFELRFYLAFGFGPVQRASEN